MIVVTVFALLTLLSIGILLMTEGDASNLATPATTRSSGRSSAAAEPEQPTPTNAPVPPTGAFAIPGHLQWRPRHTPQLEHQG